MSATTTTTISAQTDSEYHVWIAEVSALLTSAGSSMVIPERVWRWYLGGMEASTAATRLQLSR